MRKKPSEDQNSGQRELTLRFRKGPVNQFSGRQFGFGGEKLTRVIGGEAAGISLLLETLAALCRAEHGSVHLPRWPEIKPNEEALPEMKGAAPAFLAAQDRFFAPDKRSLALAFDLEDMVRAYTAARQEIHCPACREILRPVERGRLALRIMERYANAASLGVSAVLMGVLPKQKRRLISSGYQRFWIGNTQADSDNIEESGLWDRVTGVLVDVVKPRASAVHRLTEALALAGDIGGGAVFLDDGHSHRRLDLAGTTCLNCLAAVGERDESSVLLDSPTAADLHRWMTQDGPAVKERMTAQSRDVLSVLEAFSLGHLPLNRTLDELGWVEKGLCKFAETAIKGGKGRYVIADTPFWGLDLPRIEKIKAFVCASLSRGWSWIVADNDGYFAETSDQAIVLQASHGHWEHGGADDHRLTPPEPKTPPAWRACLSFRDLDALWVQEGQWVNLPSAPSLEKPWGAADWNLKLMDARQKRPVLKTASHQQAWRLCQSHRRSLAAFLGWERMLAERFVLMPENRARGLTVSRLLDRGERVHCLVCRGRGFVDNEITGRMGMPCIHCQGTGMRADPSAPRYRGSTLYDIMKLTVLEFREQFAFSTRLRQSLRLAERLGLGHLTLHRRLWTLSFSERWLCLLLSQRMGQQKGGIWIVEQPFLSLARQQENILRRVFEDFVERGGLLLTIGSDSGPAEKEVSR